jgi:hypothetical protein
MRREPTLPRRLLRYVQAGVGPVGTAGSQFVLSFVLLRALGPDAFGGFSFLFVASQFSLGLASALFCAPLPILLADADETRAAAALRALFAANLLFSGLGFVVFWRVGTQLGVAAPAAALFAAYAALTLLRWFARAYAYALLEPLRTMSSDLVYAACLSAGVAWLHGRGTASLLDAYGALAIAAAAALLPFGTTYLRRQFRPFGPASLGAYRRVWREHAGWALLGVVTTEATANAHAYAVTWLSGVTAFAPIAASALMMRPIGVAANALMEFERPQMARLIAKGEAQAATRAAGLFRFILLLGWAATVAAAVVILMLKPGWIAPRQYDRATLELGVVLWLLVALARMLRSPDSVLLQGAGAFRPLASATLASCGASIVAVLLLLRVAAPIWSITGILAGETISTGLIWRRSRRILSRTPPAEARAPRRTPGVPPAARPALRRRPEGGDYEGEHRRQGAQ